MIRDGLLALGLLLSTRRPELRIAASPIGPAELCFAVWVILALGDGSAQLAARR